MYKVKLLIIIAFVSFVYATEAEDVEQKKRGAGKPTSLNAIPTGAQKPEYTYSIYTQNPNSQNNAPSPSYQNQVPNSFYPTQAGSPGYYQGNSVSGDTGSLYPPQPQLNLLPPQSTNQFVPLNFVPTPGYQSKYQIVPSKSPGGNFQYAILQQPFNFQSPYSAYPQSLFHQGQANQFGPQQGPLVSPVPQQGFTPNYQPVGQQYVTQPSTMLLLAQPNQNIYSHLLYPNSVPNLYNNYYQANPQVKYNLLYGGSPQPNQQPINSDYDKIQIQGPVSQASQKEDNEISIQNNDYLTPAESNANYKNSYVTSRTSYKN